MMTDPPERPNFSSFFNDEKVLITGGLGFIGSNLARRLVAYGARVTVVDNLEPHHGGNLHNVEPFKQHLRVHVADVCAEEPINQLVAGQAYLFNLAGQSSHLDAMSNPLADLRANGIAQIQILEACRNHNRDVRIVFASTRQVYGVPRYLPVDERHPAQPVDINGWNKLAAEGYHQVYYRAYGIRSTTLRLTNTYGPGMRIKDDRQNFLGYWVGLLLRGQTLRIFGNGTQVRDFNYVEDVIDALLLAACSSGAVGASWNLGGGQPYSLLDTAQHLIAAHGGGDYECVPFPAERIAIDIGDYRASAEKIRADLGWKPNTSLPDGLQRTFAFYRANLSHYL